MSQRNLCKGGLRVGKPRLGNTEVALPWTDRVLIAEPRPVCRVAGKAHSLERSMGEAAWGNGRS